MEADLTTQNLIKSLHRAFILSVGNGDLRILREWAEMAGCELVPRGTEKELTMLRDLVEKMKSLVNGG